MFTRPNTLTCFRLANGDKSLWRIWHWTADSRIPVALLGCELVVPQYSQAEGQARRATVFLTLSALALNPPASVSAWVVSEAHLNTARVEAKKHL